MYRPFILQWCLGLSLAAAAASLGCQGQIGGDPVAPKTSNTGSGGNGNSTSSTGGSSPGTGGTASPGTGGSVSPGTGGSISPGTGGTTSQGTGGSTAPGAGGTTSQGTGGTTSQGTGGTISPGTGGTISPGTGGTISPGTGGSGPAGTGGASSSGSGGSGPGTGGQGGSPPDPFAAAPTCTSKTTWNGGNQGSGNMNPGMACISCHKSSGGEAPSFSLAGTLYPTAHEPDLCNGTSGSAGAQVVITGADGKTLTLTPNSAGNFYSSTSVALPYQAKVLYMGRERAMVETQSTGDCNSCHTQNGASGAPGRILLP